MNIIFGDAINDIPDSYTILQLDTFRFPEDGHEVIAYCVVEKVPLVEMGTLDAYKKIHEDLLKYYRQKEWTYCEHAIEGLMGKWGGELDSFYSSLLDRITKLKQTAPPEDWDGVLMRILPEQPSP